MRGKGANTRYVCDILPQTEPRRSPARRRGAHAVAATRRAIRRTSTTPTTCPAESSLEETYYHRLDPAQGFAFQRVYTDDRSLDESLAVENHDVVMVPRGYHPVVVPYGYESYYLNVMAGPKREWHFKQRSRRTNGC